MDNVNDVTTQEQPPIKPGMSPKAKLWIWVVIALVIIGGLWWVYKKAPKSNNQEANHPAPPKILVTEVDNSQLPAQFPTDIPLEAGATITQNFNATAPNGTFQATRAFVSKKTLAQNFQIYKTALSINGWTVQNTVDLPNQKAVVGVKDKTTVIVNIDQDPTTKVVTINISVTIIH